MTLNWTSISGKYIYGNKSWTSHYAQIEGTNISYVVSSTESQTLGTVWTIGMKGLKRSFDMLDSGMMFTNLQEAMDFVTSQNHAHWLATYTSAQA